MRRLIKTMLAVASLGILIAGWSLMAQSTPVKNILLIHGAFADGSSWSKIIPLLQSKGVHVKSVGIPLTSFADDVAATKRVIAAEHGPVILVGHSYGGLVRSDDCLSSANNTPTRGPLNGLEKAQAAIVIEIVQESGHAN